MFALIASITWSAFATQHAGWAVGIGVCSRSRQGQTCTSCVLFGERDSPVNGLDLANKCTENHWSPGLYVFDCVHISGSEVGNSNESSMNVGAIVLYAKNLPFALSTTSFLDSKRARVVLGGRALLELLLLYIHNRSAYCCCVKHVDVVAECFVRERHAANWRLTFSPPLLRYLNTFVEIQKKMFIFEFG